jgi:hypothetical protein
MDAQMSKSLQLLNGDLVVSSGRNFNIVQGRNKLAQDLVLWIQERVGTDPSNPTLGTSLDGGVINGISQESLIGFPYTPATLQKIQQELASLFSQYQQRQLDKIRTEVFLYNGKTTITPDEAIESIDNISIKTSGDDYSSTSPNLDSRGK